MSAKTIYSGSVGVAAEDYTHPLETSDGDYEDAPIEHLDVLVTRISRLDFTLHYPFEREYDSHVIGDGGVTLRQIIDAVRRGYRVMYRGAAIRDLPNLENKSVQGDYGHAFHVIGDLVIERIVLDENERRLELEIGS